MARGFYFGFTIILPELVRLLSWISVNILPALDSSGKISSQGCLAMTRTILSQDSANWWQHAFCWEFESFSTNANHYLSQSLIVARLIFGSSSTPNLSLATGPVLSRDFFYAWASPEYRDSLTIAGFRLRRLTQIGIRSAFLHGNQNVLWNQPNTVNQTILLDEPFFFLSALINFDFRNVIGDPTNPETPHARTCAFTFSYLVHMYGMREYWERK